MSTYLTATYVYTHTWGNHSAQPHDCTRHSSCVMHIRYIPISRKTQHIQAHTHSTITSASPPSTVLPTQDDTQVPTPAPPTHHPGPAPSFMPLRSHRTNSGADLHMYVTTGETKSRTHARSRSARPVGRSVYVGGMGRDACVHRDAWFDERAGSVCVYSGIYMRMNVCMHVWID